MNVIDKDTSAEKEIDLIELFKKLWNKKIFIGKVSLIGLIIGLIIAFSIPKEYSTTVILTPESKSSDASGMGALAAMAGINISQGSQTTISPDLYPDIVNSTPFIIGLLNIQVKDETMNINTTLYNYLNKDQKKVWWSSVLGFPSKFLGLFSSKENNLKMQTNITINTNNVIDLSSEQSKVIDALKNRIAVTADKKTGTITLSSTMQSPVISAYLADTITLYLQKYIIDYRTQKARQDLIYTENLYEEAQNEYYNAQKKYATYSDENLGIISARYATTKERLQNGMTLAYGVYNQMAQQLQMAKMKVQDTTPVYTIIQPAVVPHVPEKPKKKLIVLGFLFISFLCGSSWVVVKKIFNKNK